MRSFRVLLFLIVGLAIAGVIYVYASPTAQEERTAQAPTPVPAPVSRGEVLNGLVVPVAGVQRPQLVDTWGQARGQGRKHEAIDIMAAGGVPVVAAMPGRVEKLFNSVRGGITAYVRSDDGRWQSYYAHLRGYASGLHEGQRLQRGELLGYVGDTGDAGPGNTHLHFALATMRPGEKWWQGTPVNPYPILVGQRPNR